MMLLDTNVVSEIMRVVPDERVVRWLDQQKPTALFLSAVTVDEINYGIELLSEGRRQARLAQAFARIVDAFADRLLPLDRQAAEASAGIRARRRMRGAPMSLADSQIAGIAKSNGHAVATLNAKDFENAEVVVVEPL